MLRGGDPMYSSLRTSAEFDHVLRSGVRCRRGGVTLVASRRAEGRSRIGLVVGRRVGSAVVRNRVKRRLRAAVREIGLPTGVDCVVIASKAVADVPFSILCRWIRQATAGASAGRRSV